MGNKSLERAIITDVTLREYGQNVPAEFLPIFTTEIRAEITLRLIGAGLRNIEILSCVHPKLTPAMNEDALKKTSEKLGRILREGFVFVVNIEPEGASENLRRRIARCSPGTDDVVQVRDRTIVNICQSTALFWLCKNLNCKKDHHCTEND